MESEDMEQLHCGLSQTEQGNEMNSRMNRIEDWRQLARESNYSAKALANNCGVSLRQLERYIMWKMGCSPKRFLNHLRFDTSLELLGMGRLVKETAHELGFRNACHFSREFRKHYGVSPRDCRLDEVAPLIPILATTNPSFGDHAHSVMSLLDKKCRL